MNVLDHDVCAGVLTAEQCARLIGMSAGLVEPSIVSVGSLRRAHPDRTSHSVKIERLPDDVREALASCVSTFSGLPASHQERWEIIRYRAGEHFGPHYDFLPTCDASGQRLYSAAITLRAPEGGGELDFPIAQLCFAPVVGRLIAWANTTAAGALERGALHASRAVIAGVKWSLVTWVRARPIEGREGDL